MVSLNLCCDVFSTAFIDSMTGENPTTVQIKLRAACNQCHFSKVRCSGEKTGCNRCLSLGYTCVYVESRVGKVQGNRARRRDPVPEESSSSSSVASQNASTAELTTTAASTSSPCASSTVATTPPVIQPIFPELGLDRYLVSTESGGAEEALFCLNDATKPDEFSSLQWGFEDLPSVGSPMDGAPHARGPFHPETTADCTGFISAFHGSGSAPFSGPSFLYDSHLAHDRKSGGGHIFNSFGHSQAAGSSSHTDPFHVHRRSSVQCMVSCAKLVDGLEYYMRMRVMAVDEIMRMNKHCMTQVLEFLDWEKTNPNMSLLILNCLVINHVVTLFESASPQVLLPSGGYEASAGDLPSVHFGNYCLDPEQRIDIQVRIFLKELKRCGQLVERLASRGLHDRGEDPHRLTFLFPSWPEGLQTRLTALREVVTVR